MADTIGQLKKQLQAQEDIDVVQQRWFFSGKLLTDKTRLQDVKIQKDFVIQVIINAWAPGDPKPSPITAASSPTSEWGPISGVKRHFGYWAKTEYWSLKLNAENKVGIKGESAAYVHLTWLLGLLGVFILFRGAQR